MTENNQNKTIRRKAMGLAKSFFNQTRKPKGFLGGMMINRMNKGHATLSAWGRAHLDDIEAEDILDIGCGGGRNVAALLKKYPDATVTGIDYSATSVSKATSFNKDMIKTGRCQISRGDVSNLQFPSEHYDLVTAVETIYFWPGLEKCFAQVYKVMKPGGTFMVVNESDGTDEVALRFETIIDGMKCYTMKDIRGAMKAAGFSTVVAYHNKRAPWITVMATK